MRRYWSLAMVLGLTQPSHAADIQVRLNGGLVEIQATAAPLQDVLARLAQQTGMKVVYDGAPPRTLVTLTLTGRTPPEAVLALFEGLGVNYAMMSDRTGLRVDMLLVTGLSSPGATPSTSGRAGAAAPLVQPPEQRARPQRPPASEADPDDEPDEDSSRPTPPPRGPGGLNGPVQGGPAQPGLPFGGQILPLTLPTPAPGAAPPSPAPSPTPSPGRI